MPRTKLSEAAKQRKAAKTAKTTTKTTKATTKKTTKKAEQPKQELVTTAPSTPARNATVTNGVTVANQVPGLVNINPNDLQGMMPSFNGDLYHAPNPLAPPETIPQVSEADFDSGMRIYQGGIRALKLTGAAFDLTKERFTTESKRAKAFSSGVKFATDLEKVKGDYLTYQSQLETTKQGETSLGLSQHRTQVQADIRVQNELELDEKLEQATISADLAKEQTRDKRSKLEQFRKQIGSAA